MDTNKIQKGGKPPTPSHTQWIHSDQKAIMPPLASSSHLEQEYGHKEVDNEDGSRCKSVIEEHVKDESCNQNKLEGKTTQEVVQTSWCFIEMTYCHAHVEMLVTFTSLIRGITKAGASTTNRSVCFCNVPSLGS